MNYPYGLFIIKGICVIIRISSGINRYFMEEEKEFHSENDDQKEPESDAGRSDKNEDNLTLGKVFLGSKPLGFYFALIKFPIIFVVVVEIVYFLSQKSFNYVWIFDLVAFGYVAAILAKKHRLGYKEIVIGGGFTGLFIGLFVAVFKLIYFRKLFYFFNLISEPAITTLVGIFFGIAVGYVLLHIFKTNEKINKETFPPFGEKKGGELN